MDSESALTRIRRQLRSQVPPALSAPPQSKHPRRRSASGQFGIADWVPHQGWIRTPRSPGTRGHLGYGARPFSPPRPTLTLHPESRVADHHLGIPGCGPGGRGAGRGWGRGPGPWEEAGHVTPSARTRCQAGSAAKARVVAAGAEPERRGTGRRGPGTAAPGELPCHGEAGGRAGRAALEHGRFPARPHRQPLPPAHARLPRARYRVSREGTLWRGGGDGPSGPLSDGAGGTTRCTRSRSLPSLSSVMGASPVFWGSSRDNRSPRARGALSDPIWAQG